MPTFTQIGAAVVVGSGGQANIEFSSIPNTFTDLKIVYSLRSATSGGVDNVNLEFNGLSTNFSARVMTADGSAVTSGTLTQNRFYGLANGNTSTSSTFGNGELYIANYASSNNKSFFIDGVQENNTTTAFSRIGAGLWSNSAAITSIKLIADSATNWLQYSTAYLYGISNA